MGRPRRLVVPADVNTRFLKSTADELRRLTPWLVPAPLLATGSAPSPNERWLEAGRPLQIGIAQSRRLLEAIQETLTWQTTEHANPAGRCLYMGATLWPMAEWIYFIHPPRDRFAATMTEDERAVWDTHFERLQRLLAEGTLIMAGPTLGEINTGLVIIEAGDETEAHRLMQEDPAIASGLARGELRPFRVSLLRGRD
jgi:uncharacterized protein YciI